MMLAEQGRVSLHEPVSKYLPEFIGTIVGVECSGDSEGKPTLKQVPAERPMTIQDLLRHTAGLTYGLFGSSLVKTSYDEAGVFDLRNTNAEMSQKLATLPLAHQPGQVSVGFEAEAPMRDIGQSFGLGFAIRTRDGLLLGWRSRHVFLGGSRQRPHRHFHVTGTRAEIALPQSDEAVGLSSAFIEKLRHAQKRPPTACRRDRVHVSIHATIAALYSAELLFYPTLG
jgi:hypothetical protein